MSAHDETRRMLEQLPEPFRSAGLARVDAHDQRHQDEADGAALRRLREALPPWLRYSLVGPDPSVMVWDYREDATYESQRFTGRTIAEAADKCREALG